MNQAINGKKMEKEVFKQVNLQHNPKALTRTFLESWKKDHSWLEHDDV